jgi:hypothetical protein
MRSKRKSQSQVIGEEAVRVVQNLLPAHWTARPYHPDFGLDLEVEVFDDLKMDENGYSTSDTLGEHFFLQVKGATALLSQAIEIQQRTNVELPPRQEIVSASRMTIDAFAYRLETPLLATVQRMGAGLPVLLVLVDTTARRAFFVCLSDYIEKILLPTDAAYAESATQLIHVPARNEIFQTADAVVPLRFYAKRAKLMAAFQKFAYQNSELAYTSNHDLAEVTTHFAKILLRYDFWESCEFWAPIKFAYDDLQRFLRDGTPQTPSEEVLRWSQEEGRAWTDDGIEEYTLAELAQFHAIRNLWQQLSGLGKIYEEVCREWFLPTYLGMRSAY